MLIKASMFASEYLLHLGLVMTVMPLLCCCMSTVHISTSESWDESSRFGRGQEYSATGDIFLNVSPTRWSRMLMSTVGQPNADGITGTHIQEIVNQRNNSRKHRGPHQKRGDNLRAGGRNRAVDQMEPMSELRLRNKNTTGLHINWHWHITDLNGKLKLPSGKRPGTDKPYKLMIDVGLDLGSAIICELWKDPDLIYVGIEAHLINFGVSNYHMLGTVPKDDPMRKRVLLLPLGLSNVTENMPFNENYAAGCGSILKSIEGGWWCTHTINSFEIPVVRLDSLLSRIPDDYTFHYLKVDVEGADHLVVFGAGDYVSKFNMVTIECRPPKDEMHKSRHNTCQQSEMLQYMTSRGFVTTYCDFEECHFIKKGHSLEEAQRLHFECQKSLTKPVQCDPKILEEQNKKKENQR